MISNKRHGFHIAQLHQDIWWGQVEMEWGCCSRNFSPTSNKIMWVVITICCCCWLHPVIRQCNI